MQAKVFHGIAWEWNTALHLASGLECHRCGNCCRVRVRLDEPDIARIARYTNTRAKTIRGRLLDGCLPAPCPYLVNNTCSIYTARPLRCRVYPVNPHEGKVMIRLCPGGNGLAEAIECRLHQSIAQPTVAP